MALAQRSGGYGKEHPAKRAPRLPEGGYHVHGAWELLRKCLEERGLKAAEPGELALFGLWHSDDSGGRSWHCKADQSKRAAIEQCAPSSVRELTDKIRLADFLSENCLSHWAPETASSMLELRASKEKESSLWFLKHSLLSRNEGVSVHSNSQACLEAWQVISAEERGDFLAQREVPRLLLDQAGRKFTLRIYVLLLASPGLHTSAVEDDSDDQDVRAKAFARRRFVGRIHPKAYDSTDADPERHVNSTLGMPGVEFFSSDDWEHTSQVWPNIREMLSDCMKAFIQSFGASEARKVDGPPGARRLTFDLLGVDVLIDRDFRPWLLEFNRTPQLGTLPGDVQASSARERVLKDLLEAVLSNCEGHTPNRDIWDTLA